MVSAIRVLYVDDEPDLLELGKMFLEQSGDFTVTTALSAPEGIRLLEQERFDAIISDYQMPGMDGIQFLVEVRKRFGPVPFILFTGRGREEVVIQAINSGANFYLQKGGEPGAQFAELSHKIKAAASSKRADDLLRKSEEKYRNVIEDQTEFISRFLPDGTHIFVNDAYSRYFGVAREDLLGHRFRPVIHSDDREAVASFFATLTVRNPIGTIDHRIIMPDGTTRWQRWSDRAIFDADGKVVQYQSVGRDITEQKRADEALEKNTEELHAAYEELTASEEELRQNVDDLRRSTRELSESEEKFRIIADYTVNWESWFGTDGKYIWVSPSVAQFTGYTQAEILAMPDFISTVIAKEDQLLFTERFREAIGGASGENFEFRYLQKNGTKHWLNVSWQPIVDRNGNSLGTRASGHDITGRKQVEEALRTSEEKYRKAFFTSPNSICITRLYDGMFISINKGFTEISGYTEEDVIGKTSLEINIWKDPEDRRKIVEGLKTYGEVRNYEARFLTKTGEIYGSMSTSVIELNGVAHILNITSDITKRKVAEEALLKHTDELHAANEELTAADEEMRAMIEDLGTSEKALRTLSAYNRRLLEASLDPLVTISPEGRITDVNAATERVTGYSGEELIGTDFSDYFTKPEKAKEGYQRVFTDGSVRDYPLEIQHRDGHITPVLYNATVYRDESGKVQGVFAAARDITERKVAEEALLKHTDELHASNEELSTTEEELRQSIDELGRSERTLRTLSAYNRSLLEASLDPLVTISPEGRITDVNTSTERATGHSREELIGTDFSDYFTKPEKAKEGYQRVFTDGSVRDYPLEIQHRDGHTTPVLYNATVYRDESGKVQGVFAAARDITERKQTEEALLKKTDDLNVAYEELTAQNEELTANLEELARQERALRESEERFRTLVAGAKDYAIFALDPGGTILSWNEGAARIKGYQTDEIVGRNFSVFYLPEDIQNGKPEEELKIARNSGRFETDALRIRKGGTQFWANVIITPMRNERGEVTGFSKITRDITERKQAEEALEKKTDDLNAAYENLTATEEELRANLEELTRQELALRDLNAYNRSLLEASIDPLVTISPEGRITDVNTSTEKVTGHSGEELIGTDFSDYFTEPEKAKEGYHRVFTDGTIRDYPLEVRHTDGHITPVLYNATVYRDETGKVSGVFAAARDVTELKSTQDALEQKAQELTRSNIELEQFAFIASHDLQEPLRMIASFVQLIESEYKGKLGEDGDRWIGFAVDGSKRLQAMINGLLLYSRVETKGNIFSNVDLEIVLREVLGGADMIIQETKSEITHEPLPVVYGDPGQLIQLLQNLILNGIKFNKKTPPKVHISAQKKKNNWVVSVRDNGIGIADADRDKLFLMFRRISRKEYPGTGIGLALCKRIVDRHGGKIWVDSKEGEGSVFSFNIPIVTENHHVKT